MKKGLILTLGLWCMLAMAQTALAATVSQAHPPGSSFTVVGRLWSELGYQWKSKELATNQYGLTMQRRLRGDYSTSFVNLNANSYFGVRWTSGDKTTGAYVTADIASGAQQLERLTLQHGYGWHQIGRLKLVAGHTDGVFGSLLFAPQSLLGTTTSAKILLMRWGFLYSGRQPQVRLECTTPYGMGSIALAQAGSEVVPSLGALRIGDQTVGSAPAYADFPRVDLAWVIKTDSVVFIPGASFSRLGYDGAPAGFDDSFSCWVAQLPVMWTMGGFDVRFQAYYGANIDVEWNQNPTLSYFNQIPALPVWVDGKIDDTMQWGGSIMLSYVIDQWTPRIGFGYVSSSNDGWKKAGLLDDNYQRWAAMLALTYRVNNYLQIQPEIDYYNYGDNIQADIGNLAGTKLGSDYGYEVMAGVSMIFTF